MVDLLTEMVSIFRSEELARETAAEKKIEEVDPLAADDVYKEDLPKDKGDSEKEDTESDQEEEDPADVEKETANDQDPTQREQ